MIVEITADPIDGAALIRAVSRPPNGGICSFAGIVRDNAEGRRVIKLEYEAFGSMALAKLHEIVDQVRDRWGTADVAIAHRVGELQIGEASVFIAVGAPHRGEAFEACRFIIDTLKTTVPIWKKEFFEDGAVWVEPVPTASASG